MNSDLKAKNKILQQLGWQVSNKASMYQHNFIIAS